MADKPTDENLKKRIRELEEKVSVAEILGKQAFRDHQFLNILLDTIPSPIFYKDRKGVYCHCNEAFAKEILGLNREQVINKSLFDLPDEIPIELAQLYFEKDEALFNNPGVQTYKGEASCSDGIVRTFQFYKSTILNEAGHVDGLVGIMLDITNMEENRSKLEMENSELKSLSYIGGLTGVLNRRKFESVFPSLLEDSGKSNTFFNFALIDIDHFKLYNDNYGHPEGDEALKSVAATIEKNLGRPYDYVFRIGGEEFCVLFHSRDKTDALQIAENIRTGVERLAIKHAYNGAKGVLTISTGLLSIHSPTIDKLQIYEKADKLLYDAKRAGRNITMHEIL